MNLRNFYMRLSSMVLKNFYQTLCSVAGVVFAISVGCALDKIKFMYGTWVPFTLGWSFSLLVLFSSRAIGITIDKYLEDQ